MSRMLSAREFEVAIAIYPSRRVKDAALLLGISPRTASKHLERIYRKLEIHGKTELALWLSGLVRRWAGGRWAGDMSRKM